jgi:hypothetical protein
MCHRFYKIIEELISETPIRNLDEAIYIASVNKGTFAP